MVAASNQVLRLDCPSGGSKYASLRRGRFAPVSKVAGEVAERPKVRHWK